MLDTKTDSRPKKAGPKTLAEAKTLLASLRKTAIARGIRPSPSNEEPRTLDKARTAIANLERSLAGTTASVVPIAKPASTGPALASESANLFAKAGIIAKKYKQHANRHSSAQSVAPVPIQAPEDMSRSELIAAIDRSNRSDRKKIGPLWSELQRREKGESSRRSIERASGLTDLELEKEIEREKDLDTRGELFTILRQREEYRRKN